jgi:hypothetical protein
VKFTDAPTDTKPNVLLYGPPKSGKSAGAASAPGSLLYLNFDLDNALAFAREQAGDRLKTPVFEGLRTMQEVLADAPNWDTIVVDPVGDMYRRLLEIQTNDALRPSLPIRGDVSIYLERWFRALCQAPANVVFVAHDFLHAEEGSEVPAESVPWTGTKNPSLGRKLMGMVDVIGFTARMEGDEEKNEPAKYVAQLINAKGRRGGDRFNCLGDFRELNLSEWFDRIAESKGATPNENAGATPAERKAA